MAGLGFATAQLQLIRLTTRLNCLGPILQHCSTADCVVTPSCSKIMKQSDNPINNIYTETWAACEDHHQVSIIFTKLTNKINSTTPVQREVIDKDHKKDNSKGVSSKKYKNWEFIEISWLWNNMFFWDILLQSFIWKTYWWCVKYSFWQMKQSSGYL